MKFPIKSSGTMTVTSYDQVKRKRTCVKDTIGRRNGSSHGCVSAAETWSVSDREKNNKTLSRI